MKKILFLLTCISIIACSRSLTSIDYSKANSQKGILYNLPKSIIKLDLEYSIYKDYYFLNGEKIYTSNPYAKLENPITVTSVSVPDDKSNYILTYKKNNSNYFYEDNYTVELNSNGTIKSLNWETENVIPDIASNIISTGLNIFKTISPASDESAIDEKLNLISHLEKEVTIIDNKIKLATSKENLKKVKELKELQNIIISRVEKLKTLNKKGQKDKTTKSVTLYINLEKDYSEDIFIDKQIDTTSKDVSYIIDLKSKFKGIDEESFPKVVLTLPINTGKNNSAEGVKYRLPKKVSYTLTLKDVNDIEYPERLLISSDIQIIQYGDINSFPLTVKGSKKSKIALTIDEKTGLITKVSNTSNSILKESSSFLKTSSEEIYNTFDDYSFKKKKKELENEKSLLELQSSIDNLTKDEVKPTEIEVKIAELKFLLERLELEKKIKELEDNEE
ncbi:MAG: hypothetical protein R2781_03560 [Flavobacteriaceae bacterium]